MWRARCEGPRTSSRPKDANLDCAFVENALVFVAPKIGSALAPPWSQLVVPLGQAESSYLNEGEVGLRFTVQANQTICHIEQIKKVAYY